MLDQERVGVLLGRMKDVPANERLGFLQRECADSIETQSEILRLLADDSVTRTIDSGLMAARSGYSLQPGDLVASRFSILSFLGRGGMGEVYKAEDLELGGWVALKVLRPEAANDERFLKRFRREVQTARRVTHPSVCRIFDVGAHSFTGGERPMTFLTMEFLDGVTLSQHLRSWGRMSFAEMVPLICQIAEGLDALHQKGIVHRDFKPGNVMIVQGRDGAPPRAFITDFGLARTVLSDSGEAADTELTQTGRAVGTPEYMAPEQLLGRDITPAADIYALGITIYEMLTGTRPFSAASGLAAKPGTKSNSKTGAAAPLSTHVPNVPRACEDIVQRCLELDPDKRPLSALEVADRLTGSGRRTDAVAATRKKWVTAAAFLLIALIAGFWGTLHSGLLRLPGATPAAPPRQHIAVLAFTVPGQDPELSVFADGLMEGITGRLSQFESPGARLLVVPSSVVRQQAAKTPDDARAKLGADEVIQGTLQTQGDRVRLMLTLIDARQMRQINTVIVDDKRANALSLEDAAIEKLAGALSLRLTADHSKEAVATLAPGAYEYYLQARGYLQRADKLPSLDSAIALFHRVLELDSKSAIAYAGLGEAYQAKFSLTRDTKWVDEALKNCSQALRLNPSLPDAHLILGRIHLDTGHFDEAQKDFETALAADGRDSRAWQGLASAYEGLKLFDKAEATYRKAIALRPEDWNGYRQLGLFYYKRANYDKAIEQYRQVVALTPDNAQGYTNLGAMQMLKGANADAQKSLERALELDPKRVSTLTNLAKLYFDQEQYPRAIELYDRASALSSADFRTHGLLGIAWKRMGNDARARPPLETAVRLVDGELKLNPKKAQFLSYKALYESALGRKKEAAASLAKAVELSPADVDILIRAAETEATMGNNQNALGFIARAKSQGFPPEKLLASPPLRPLLKAAK